MAASSSLVPEVIDAVVAQTAAPLAAIGAMVSDGDLMPALNTTALLVGVDDNELDGTASSASETQDWANAHGAAVDASGTVTCAIYSWSTDRNQKTARDQVYAVADVLATVCAATPTLGIPRLLWTRAYTQQALRQRQTDQGAYALLIVSLFYRARV